MTTTYPPAPSLLASNTALEFLDSWIYYVGYDGTIYHLSGPFAPTMGAENGFNILTISGMHSPFKHLDNQGARQDGTTWYDSVYDPGEIDMVIEATGMSAKESRQTIASWMGSWDPKQLGKLCWFSPERGEWWADVRQAKSPPDQFTQSYYRTGRVRFTWSARNDDAFWKSVDSVSQFGAKYNTVSDTFQRANATSLGTNWNQTYSPASSGTCGVTNKTCQWQTASNNTCTVTNFYTSGSATDNQVVSITFGDLPMIPFPGSVYNDIWGRWDNNGNGIRARIGYSEIILSRFNSGVETVMATLPNLIPPWFNETWTLICGTETDPREFIVQRSNFTAIDHTEFDNGSVIGSANRGWGFGMEAGSNIFGTQDLPAWITEWAAADNITVSQSGFLPLTNIGDQDGWPRYLIYGPGTFTIGDGVSSGSVTFGPLGIGQVALLTTLPRLRSVVDLSPGQPQQQLSQWQELLSQLESYAYNNNIPPLVQQYESQFGILPPQGNMYSLLNGRFTTPIPPMQEQVGPQTTHIPISIVDGGPTSAVVAALTPMRKWPE